MQYHCIHRLISSLCWKKDRRRRFAEWLVRSFSYTIGETINFSSFSFCQQTFFLFFLNWFFDKSYFPITSSVGRYLIKETTDIKTDFLTPIVWAFFDEIEIVWITFLSYFDWWRFCRIMLLQTISDC